MSLFGNLFKSSTRPNLKTIDSIIPGGVKTVETRPFEECKQISAYVVFDIATDAAILYLDTGLAWIEEFKPRNLGLESLFDEEGLKANSQMDTPQLVTEGATLSLNRYTSMRFLLIGQDDKAIHITIPWPPPMFEQFARKRPVMFIGLHDGKAFLNGKLAASERETLFKRYVHNVFG